MKRITFLSLALLTILAAPVALAEETNIIVPGEGIGSATDYGQGFAYTWSSSGVTGLADAIKNAKADALDAASTKCIQEKKGRVVRKGIATLKGSCVATPADKRGLEYTCEARATVTCAVKPGTQSTNRSDSPARDSRSSTSGDTSGRYTGGAR